MFSFHCMSFPPVLVPSSLIMVFEDSFICLQQRIINSLYCFTCAGFQRWKRTKVFLKLLFDWGGGIYARTKVEPSKIKAATTQFKSQIKEQIFFFFFIIACGVLSFHQSSHFSLLVFMLLFLKTFQSLPFCERLLSFLKNFLLFAFAVLLYKK